MLVKLFMNKNYYAREMPNYYYLYFDKESYEINCYCYRAKKKLCRTSNEKTW